MNTHNDLLYWQHFRRIENCRTIFTLELFYVVGYLAAQLMGAAL